MKRITFMILAALAAAAAGAAGEDQLLSAFRSPPPAARPQVWWHWMNGNVTREGIVADLDAMAAVGIGGATIFDVGVGIPPGPVKFNTQEWIDTVAFAVAEAAKRRIEICLHNCSGYSTSGGPWIAPSNSMKVVSYSLVDVAGPRRFAAALSAPPNKYGFYEDVAVLAWPVPAAERSPDGAAGKIAEVKRDGKEIVYEFEYPADFRASRWECRIRDAVHAWNSTIEATLSAADADGKWREVSRETLYARYGTQDDENVRSFGFVETSARRWRLVVKAVDCSTDNFKFEAMPLSRSARISNIANKGWFVSTGAATRPYSAAPDQVVRSKDVLDLTAKFDRATGVLDWDVPAGAWRVMRVGYAANGMRCNPASDNGAGLECDKLAKAGVRAVFGNYVAWVCDRVGPSLAGKVEFGLNSVLVDSWEAGTQNWTQGFEREFARRRGYDIATWLPTLAGVVVDGVDESERFLADFRDVISHLLAENFSDELARLCHERGLRLSAESYGGLPSTPELYGRAEDITMCEFWINPGCSARDMNDGNVRSVVARARKRPDRGNRIIAAEAFTAWPTNDRWKIDPYTLKSTGDHMYALGVNRMVYHRYAHQPWTKGNLAPGMTMGPWGTHFERTNTWWFDQKGWIDYQTRCQALLQAGEFVDEKTYGDEIWIHRRYADGTDGFFVACDNAETRAVQVSLPVTGRVPEIWDAETGEISLAPVWTDSNNRTWLSLKLRPSGSAFVMFRPRPTSGAAAKRAVRETAADEVKGTWTVSFEASYPDVPAPVKMKTLASLSKHSNPEVRYFAGHATYRMKFADAWPRNPGDRVVLDLGEVKNLAAVTVNGREFPVLWRPPFRVDVTDAWKEENEIAVRVTTLWPNRLIGDELLPEDRVWQGAWHGGSVAKVPEWVRRGEKSPTGRHTFTTWRHWHAEDKDNLVPAGLLGPVKRVVMEE